MDWSTPGDYSGKAVGIFGPLKNKMKVLKKIKRRMGLGQYVTISTNIP